LLCGISGSFLILVLSRGIQAAGAAATMATNQGIITEVFPQSERGKALGFIGTAVALGSLIGPGLGGMMIGATKWEYIFLINVPVGLVALFYSFKLLPKDLQGVRGKLDGFGALLFALTVVPLFLSLSEALNRGFADPLIITGFIVAIFSFIAFILLEQKRKHPLINLQIFMNKLFSLSILCGFLTFVVLFCNNIILPFYLQDIMAYLPQQAGLIMMIYPLLLMVIAPASGHLSDKIGSEILTFIGLLVISVGLLEMATLTEHSSIVSMVIFIGIMSVGMGLFQSPNNSLVMSTVTKDKLGIAGSINALVRNLGMVSGISLATTLLYSSMSSKIGHRVTDFVPGRNDAFVYGMKTVYITAGMISLAGALLTLLRLIEKRTRTSREKGFSGLDPDAD
jgi:EmrB/QacA subfamily drug resistance transporter